MPPLSAPPLFTLGQRHPSPIPRAQCLPWGYLSRQPTMLDLSTRPPSSMRPGEVSPYTYHRLGLHPPSPPQTMVSSGTGPRASHSQFHSPPTFVPFCLLPRDPLASRLSNISLGMPTSWTVAWDSLQDIPSLTSTLTPTQPPTP